MELSNIKKLLQKYFEGDTTISEEKKLKVYFTGEHVSPDLERYRSMFNYFHEESQIKLSKQVSLKRNKSTRYWWVGAAASIVLIGGLFLTKVPSDNDHDLGTYDDPEVALAKTKEVLNLVSQYMNEGKKELVYLNEIENTKNKFLK